MGVYPVRYLKDVYTRMSLNTEKDLKMKGDFMKVVKIKILGSGQDAAIPHPGCFCEVCSKARVDPRYGRLGPSCAIFDNDQCYLIDASPDFKSQLDMVYDEMGDKKREGKTPVTGILLTHAHPGHCLGLWHLGKESMDEKNLPVYCTPKMERLLKSSSPFSLLIQRDNIKIHKIQPEEEFELEGIKCVAISVPHRDETADTVGYILKSKKRAIYLPDVDYWTDVVIDEIKASDLAIIDGTFYSRDEISRFSQVPHPPIKDTIDLLRDTNTDIYFTHVNHTNAINLNGKERKYVEEKGFKIAFDGMIIDI